MRVWYGFGVMTLSLALASPLGAKCDLVGEYLDVELIRVTHDDVEVPTTPYESFAVYAAAKEGRVDFSARLNVGVFSEEYEPVP